jgi:hypothetical protein
MRTIPTGEEHLGEPYTRDSSRVLVLRCTHRKYELVVVLARDWPVNY